jgi:hypothetical protein
MKIYTINLAVLLSLFALSSCSWSVDRVKRSSPLKEKLVSAPESEVRSMILKSLPLGSSIVEVKAYCHANFRGKQVRQHALYTGDVASARGTKYLCYRVKENGTWPVGSNWTELLFYLSKDDKLTDIVVGSYGVCL